MHLTPTERDRLLLFSAAELARARRRRGLLLNAPEATALVADEVCEVARSGGRHQEAIEHGRSVLTAADVMPGVPAVVRSVSVEAVFADGSRLVVVDSPFGPAARGGEDGGDAAPGAVVRAGDQRVAGATQDAVSLTVVNTAAVPVSVTSHFHFFETNPRLLFPRRRAYGRHLELAAGRHVRFEPGIPTTVSLVPFAGERVVIGFAGLVDGPLDAPGAEDDAVRRARACGFADTESTEADLLGPGPAGAAAKALRLGRGDDA